VIGPQVAQRPGSGAQRPTGQYFSAPKRREQSPPRECCLASRDADDIRAGRESSRANHASARSERRRSAAVLRHERTCWPRGGNRPLLKAAGCSFPMRYSDPRSPHSGRPLKHEAGITEVIVRNAAAMEQILPQVHIAEPGWAGPRARYPGPNRVDRGSSKTDVRRLRPKTATQHRCPRKQRRRPGAGGDTAQAAEASL